MMKEFALAVLIVVCSFGLLCGCGGPGTLKKTIPAVADSPSKAAQEQSENIADSQNFIPDGWTPETLPPLSPPVKAQFEIMDPNDRRQEYNELIGDMITGLKLEIQLDQGPSPEEEKVEK